MTAFAAALDEYLAPPSLLRRRLFAGAAAALLLAAAVFFLHLYRRGTIALEVDDPLVEAAAQVDGQPVALGQPLRLSEGEHFLRVRGSDCETVEQSFTVRRGANAPLRVPVQLKVGQLRRFRGHTEPIWSAAFSPDGRRIVSGGGGKLEVKEGISNVSFAGAAPVGRMWDVRSGQLQRQLQGHTSAISQVAFTADGQHILTGSADHTLRVWNAATGEQQRLLQTKVFWRAGFSGDGRRALCDRQGKVTRQDSGELVQEFSLRLWDLTDDRELRTFGRHWTLVTGLAVSADGRRGLSTGADGTARLWNLETGKERHALLGHINQVMCAALSADGTRAVTGGSDQTVRLWDANSGRELHRLDGHRGTVLCVALSPDGRRILSGGYDHTVRLWDASSGRQLRSFEGHTLGVTCVAFAPDGRRAVSGSVDHSLRLWALPK